MYEELYGQRTQLNDQIYGCLGDEIAYELGATPHHRLTIDEVYNLIQQRHPTISRVIIEKDIQRTLDWMFGAKRIELVGATRTVKLTHAAIRTLGAAHKIDQTRTIVHDYDRAGDYYSAWCVCGQQIADRLPHYKHNPTDHPGCKNTVEDAMDQHLRHVSRQTTQQGG